MARSRAIAMILLLCLGIVSVIPVHGDAASEIAALFALQAAIADTNPMQWNASSYYCQWQGVSCIDGAVTEIWLPGQGLKGQIPKGILGNLPHLTVLSLSLNLLSGPLPDDLTNCHQLTDLIMQHNLLSGALPADFSVWPNLRVIDLSYNNFSGLIPPSITFLKNLVGVLLQSNSLTGPLPQMDATRLLDFSVANNHLSGSVSGDLVAKFPGASFSGNSFCGPPLAMPCFTYSARSLSLSRPSSFLLHLPPSPQPVSPPPSLQPLSPSPSPFAISSSSVFFLPPEITSPGRAPHMPMKKLGVGLITAIAIADAIIGVLLLLLLFYVCRRLERRPCCKGFKMGSLNDITKMESSKGVSSLSGAPVDGTNFVFFKDASPRFDIEELLQASAKVLGKGCMGSSYRAALDDGSIIVVKRLKSVDTMHRELRVLLQVLCRLHHPNLLSPRGFYLANCEKLLLHDYCHLGSLSTLLHGNRGEGRIHLDWVARVQIGLGAARGISYLHELGLVHGNVKSSNVLIEKKYLARVSDFGLADLFSKSIAAASHNVGYRAPETVKTGIVTQKADVYSFGVLLLELLTGKAPIPTSPNDDGINLPHWVQSVVCEEWTIEVFDLELLRYQNIEDEMVQMLQIAMGCISTIPGDRPRMNQIVTMLQDIRPVDSFEKSEEVSVDVGSYSSFFNPTSVSDFTESTCDSTSYQTI